MYVCIVHIYPPFTRKRIVSLYFGRDVRTRLGVAISEMSGPPVFHIKAEASRYVPYPRAQQANLPACFLQPHINAERQAASAKQGSILMLHESKAVLYFTNNFLNVVKE